MKNKWKYINKWIKIKNEWMNTYYLYTNEWINLYIKEIEERIWYTIGRIYFVHMQLSKLDAIHNFADILYHNSIWINKLLICRYPQSGGADWAKHQPDALH